MTEIIEKEPFLYVFLKDSMCLGGIETYIFHLSRFIVTNGGCVLIALNENGRMDESFRTLRDSSQIQITYSRRCLKEMKKQIETHKIKKVNIIAFEVVRFAYAVILKRLISSKCNVSALYFVPHFQGIPSYPEDPYSGKTRERIRKRFEKIVHKMNENDNIRYFSQTHAAEMIKRYRYTIHDEKKQYLPIREIERIPFDDERCLNLANRTQFNILAVSRLEFPHKGFVIGLIRVYGTLKKKYPNITLTIVGYGDGFSMVNDEINQLDLSAKNDVKLIGKVSPDDLLTYYFDANVSVSLAECFAIGARVGTLSLPARHYSYTCETYGFLPESKSYSVSSDPGKPIIDYLEKIINMDVETYVEMCKKCYDAYNNTNTNEQRETIFTLSDGGKRKILSTSDIVFLISERIKAHFFNKLKK